MLLVIIGILFHFLLDETMAEAIEDTFYDFFESNFNCYIKDAFIGGVWMKFLNNVDLNRVSETLDSLVQFDIKESTMLPKEDDSSHY